MKLGKFTVANALCLIMMSATAQNYTDTNNQAEQSTSDNTKKIVQYMTNWAAYLGYDIAEDKTPPLASTELTSYANASLLETLLYSTFFGSIPTTTPPITSASSSSSSSSGDQGVGLPFLPKSDSTTAINAASNLTFKNYNNTGDQQSSQQVSINANSLADQPPYQADPVSQAIFNILGTPDISYCSSTPGSNPLQGISNSTNPSPNYQASTTPCAITPTMFQVQLVENVVGAIPGPSDFYTITSNANVLPQLNSNSLIAPLNYSTDPLDFSAGNATSTTGGPGLTAKTQAELASNFIRYASGSVLPTILPNKSIYQTVYNQAIDKTNTAQPQMQAVISNYLTSLRVYAAQSSVGIGNLYYILSKRLPQQQKGAKSNESGQQNSQALNEYNMATWRIFQVGGVPASSSSSGSSSGSSGSSSNNGQAPTQWIEKINAASPAALQKEIAILLAEINYQLYLDRQLQERMLMTSSISLLQGTKATQPSSDLSNQLVSASTTQPPSSP